MSENLKIIYTPPKLVVHSSPKTPATDFVTGTVVMDEAGLLWEVYFDTQDRMNEWRRK